LEPFPLSIAPFENKMAGLPWSLDLVLICLFFFYGGFVLKDVARKDIVESTWLLLAALGLFILSHVYSDAVLDLSLRRYDHLGVCTLEAVCGIVVVVCIAKKICYSKWLKNVFSYVGKLSLIILIFHYFIQGYTYSEVTRIFGYRGDMEYLLSFAGGVVGSIVFYELVLKRVSFLGRLYGVTPAGR
jgi:fucose 4-O-acetylase-like acetyltransferase